MTNIDNNRNSQINYNKKKQSPYTHYGPYSSNGDVPDFLSANEERINQFEMLSAGGYSAYKSPATMQEFQYSKQEKLHDHLSDNYGPPSSVSNVPINHSNKKTKFESMRKQNISNVANNILSNGNSGKMPKNQQMRTKSVDDDISDSNSNQKQVTDYHYAT